MKLLVSYGAAAKPTLPELRKLVVQSNADTDFPDWAKKQRTASVEAAIQTLEAATAQPALRSLADNPPKGGGVK